MNKPIAVSRLLLTVVALMVISCGVEEVRAQNSNNDEYMTQKLYLTIGDRTLTATLVKNSATEALMAALVQEAITVEADDYGGFEKVGALGRSLPTSNRQITTQPGDIILYNGNQIVLFYGSNSWNYTRLGRIDFETIDQLRNFLKAGQGRVSVTLALKGVSGLSQVEADTATDESYVSLTGVRTDRPSGGIYIKNGKKVIK